MVQAVYFRNSTPPTGGTCDVEIEVRRQKTARPAVGIVEEYLGGAGPQWRAAAWIAAFNASLYTGKPLVDYEFLVRSTGFIDGPSAGMLTTATFVALLEGLPIQKNVTMTGTINPDMSAGPVGGIPQKMEGAARFGKTKFGYPVGTRRSKDLASGRNVDLRAVGQSLGLKAVEIKNIDDAVALLTGIRPARRQRVSTDEMELNEKEVNQYEQALNSWAEILNKEARQTVKILEKTGAREVAEVMQFSRSAVNLINRFQAERQQGAYQNAERSCAQALAMLYTTKDLALMLYDVSQQNFTHLTTRLLENMKWSQEIEKRLMRLLAKAKKSSSLEEHLALTSALYNVVNGYAFSQVARESFAEHQAELKEFKAGDSKKAIAAIYTLTKPLLYLNAARAQLILTNERLKRMYAGIHSKTPVSTQSLQHLGRAYASAGAASLGYVDTLYTHELAKNSNVTQLQATQYVEQKDLRFRMARRVNALAIGQKRYPSLALAAGMYTWLVGGGLVNRYYSLNATRDKQGVLHISRRRALTHQLELAQNRALEAAFEAQQILGSIPIAAKDAFLAARASREGNDEDKLDALENFWKATALCDLLAHISENSKKLHAH